VIEESDMFNDREADVSTSGTRRKFLSLGVAVAATSAVPSAQVAAQMPANPGSLSLTLEGKSVTLNDPKKFSFEMNKSLLNKEVFKEFSQDPELFSTKNGIKIDPALAETLKRKLKGVSSLEEAQTLMKGGCLDCATLWAVAEGSYSVASSKIAVAY